MERAEAVLVGVLLAVRERVGELDGEAPGVRLLVAQAEALELRLALPLAEELRLGVGEAVAEPVGLPLGVGAADSVALCEALPDSDAEAPKDSVAVERLRDRGDA